MSRISGKIGFYDRKIQAAKRRRPREVFDMDTYLANMQHSTLKYTERGDFAHLAGRGF